MQVVLIELLVICVGSYIGMVVVKELDGMLCVFEVYVFLEVMCGIGDGYCLYDMGLNSSMINGMVEQVGVVIGA